MVVYIKAYSRMFFVMGVAAVLAYAFGFHLMITQGAMQALYWGGYFFATYIVGNTLMNLLF